MKTFTALCLSLLTATHALAAETFYVDAGGSNDNPGTKALPFRTIQKAADSVKNPGDRVIVNAGTYEEMVDFSTSGDADAPITFEANGDVIVQGARC